MFSGLRENAPIYILTKGERPTLQVGTVINVSNPIFGPMYNQTMEVKVKIDESSFDLKSLPCNQSSHYYAKENAFVSDNTQEMLAEVENMRRASQGVLDSVASHEEVVKACEGMLVMLNPQIAKDKERQEQIDSLQQRMGGIESTLGQMMGLLQQSLKKSKD